MNAIGFFNAETLKLQSFWGSDPDPDGGTYSAPPYPLAGREGCPLPHPPRGSAARYSAQPIATPSPLPNPGSATGICPVIEVVLDQMAGLKITALPEPCTVSYLANELRVLSGLQVGEIMYNGKDITLSWDSTTVNGENINQMFQQYHQNHMC